MDISSKNELQKELPYAVVNTTLDFCFIDSNCSLVLDYSPCGGVRGSVNNFGSLIYSMLSYGFFEEGISSCPDMPALVSQRAYCKVLRCEMEMQMGEGF